MDGYRWFQYGSKFIPRRNPVLKKLYFTSVLASGHDHRFKRLVFFLLSETSKAVVIHYVGDESIAVDFPHGNSKEDNSHVFKRTCPSVLTTLSTNTKNSPSSLYKSAISNPPTECPPTLQSMYMPRNLRQIKNIQYKARQKCRLTHDAIYNLHEIAYDLDGFVKVITTYPDLVIICGLDKLIHEFELILQIDSKCPQLLSYDTTFQLGDFYLSPFLYRYTVFSNSPVIPCLFLIHERKFKNVHERFMQYLANSVPTLLKGKKKVPLVTDEEVGIKMVSN